MINCALISRQFIVRARVQFHFLSFDRLNISRAHVNGLNLTKFANPIINVKSISFVVCKLCSVGESCGSYPSKRRIHNYYYRFSDGFDWPQQFNWSDRKTLRNMLLKFINKIFRFGGKCWHECDVMCIAPHRTIGTENTLDLPTNKKTQCERQLQQLRIDV